MQQLSELLTASHQSPLHGILDLQHIITDILLGGALERDSGRDDADIDSDRIFLRVDVIKIPFDSLGRNLCHDISAGLKEKRNAIRESEDVDALFDRVAAQGDGGLDEEGMAFVDARLVCVGCDKLWFDFFYYSQPEIIFS
jgi:hypothetical protein